MRKIESLAICSMKSQKGFTFLELILVLGIVALLFSIGYLNISNFRVFATKSNTVSVIISDIKSQQIKAMAGDTEGRGEADTYGVKLLNDSYSLFHGINYNPTEESNFTIPVPEGYSISSTFPNDEVIFASGSGEIVNFNQSQNTITLTNTSTSETRSIYLNIYGAITQVD